MGDPLPRALVFVGPDDEDLEVWYPLLRLREAGFDVVTAGPGESASTGKRGYPIRHDLVHAGARYHDKDVVVDGNLVTSRKPDDLPAFMRAILLVASSLRAMAAARRH